jgi:hypothetical protein
VRTHVAAAPAIEQALANPPNTWEFSSGELGSIPGWSTGEFESIPGRSSGELECFRGIATSTAPGESMDPHRHTAMPAEDTIGLYHRHRRVIS